MKFKYYLRGFGLGILFTTFILIISIQLHGGIMTDERVVERAKELGMISTEESEETEHSGTTLKDMMEADKDETSDKAEPSDEEVEGTE